MTAPLADSLAPKDFSRSLTLRFSALLFLFVVLSCGTYLAVSSAVSAKDYDSIVLNIAGRQRMLTERYARQINQVLVGLAVSDWDMAVEMKDAASQTAASYEETLAAFVEGGEIDTDKEGRFWIPPVHGRELVEHLDHVQAEWEQLRRTALQAMRSDSSSLAKNHFVRDIQTQTTNAVAEMNHAAWLMQEQSEVRLSRVESYMIYACALSALLFVGTVAFVRTKIVAPLRDSMTSLRSARVRAEAADRSKSEFLANMSHEIRTPMTAILGFSETIAENTTEPENVEAIATIRRNGNSLLRIIDDILDLSKVEAGKMTVEQIAFKPCELIDEVASLMGIRADAKGLALSIEYIGDIPETIKNDPTRLRQILINLIGNSIKFTQEGAVRLVVRLVGPDKSDQAGSPTESYLQFDVLDSGPGMSDEQATMLFKPFSQADTSTTRKFGGTGLGLTVSKRFAELLGGDVTLVESEVGVGTRFRATVATGSLDGVPMLDNPRSATVAAGKPDGPARVLPSDLHGLHILLAEDGQDNQRLISFVLKKVGADVTAVENGKLALDAALAARDEGHPFDVILMDMQMPVMDGYEATGQLRQKCYTEPIIALTAHAMEGDRKKCLEAGCDDYITKPIDRKKLAEMIQQHLVQSEAASPVAT